MGPPFYACSVFHRYYKPCWAAAGFRIYDDLTDEVGTVDPEASASIDINRMSAGDSGVPAARVPESSHSAEHSSLPNEETSVAKPHVKLTVEEHVEVNVPKASSIERFKVQYVGKVGVLKPEGVMAVTEADAKVRAGIETGFGHAPVDAVFEMGESFGVGIRQIGAGLPIAHFALTDVSFTHLAANTGVFTIITTDVKTRLMVCHVLDMPDIETGQSISAALEEHASKSVSRARASSISRKPGLSAETSNFVRQPSNKLKVHTFQLASEKKRRQFSVRRISREISESGYSAGGGIKKPADPRAPIAITTCRYVGSTMASAQRGEQAAVAAIKQVKKMSGRGSERVVNDVAAVTSLEGFKIVEVSSSELLIDVFIKDITAVVVLTELAHLQLLATAVPIGGGICPGLVVTHVNSRLGTMTAEILQCADTAEARAIEAAIETGKKAAREVRSFKCILPLFGRPYSRRVGTWAVLCVATSLFENY